MSQTLSHPTFVSSLFQRRGLLRYRTHRTTMAKFPLGDRTWKWEPWVPSPPLIPKHVYYPRDSTEPGSPGSRSPIQQTDLYLSMASTPAVPKKNTKCTRHSRNHASQFQRQYKLGQCLYWRSMILSTHTGQSSSSTVSVVPCTDDTSAFTNAL
jgi:hypothetical protein